MTEILKELKKTAEVRVDTGINMGVMSVPADFDMVSVNITLQFNFNAFCYAIFIVKNIIINENVTPLLRGRIAHPNKPNRFTKIGRLASVSVFLLRGVLTLTAVYKTLFQTTRL